MRGWNFEFSLPREQAYMTFRHDFVETAVHLVQTEELRRLDRYSKPRGRGAAKNVEGDAVLEDSCDVEFAKSRGSRLSFM